MDFPHVNLTVLPAGATDFSQDGGVGKTRSPQFSAIRLARAREEAGLSNAQLADRLGVRRQEVVRWQAKVSPRTPQPKMQLQIAHVLKVDLTELLEQGSTSLAALRTARGLTQAELAELSGIARSTLQALETGKIATLGTDQARRLARALKASPESIEQAHQAGVLAHQPEPSADGAEQGRRAGLRLAALEELADGVDQLAPVLRLQPHVEQQLIETSRGLRTELSRREPDRQRLRRQADKCSECLAHAPASVGKRAMQSLVRSAVRSLDSD